MTTKLSIWLAAFALVLSFAAISEADELSDREAEYKAASCDGKKKAINELKENVARLESEPWTKERGDELEKAREALKEKETAYKTCEQLEEVIKQIIEATKKEGETQDRKHEDRNSGAQTKTDRSPSQGGTDSSSKSDPMASPAPVTPSATSSAEDQPSTGKSGSTSLGKSSNECQKLLESKKPNNDQASILPNLKPNEVAAKKPTTNNNLPHCLTTARVNTEWA